MSDLAWDKRHVFVTGACGTVGRELVRQLLSLNPARVVAIDNNETELFFLQQDYREDQRLSCHLVDVCDTQSLTRRMTGCDIVIHAAALKHVPICESDPAAAVRVNIHGVQSIIDAARAAQVERVLFTSSDKAVNPTNVMGTTKLMGERLIIAAAEMEGPVFACTRFGNVLGSRGSVIPLFQRQIATGGPVTLTDQRMSRFVMTLEDATELVLQSALMAKGGEIFVTKMPVAEILTLAKVMVAQLAEEPHRVSIEEIGSRPGEKLYEELMTDVEVPYTAETDSFFIIQPSWSTKVDTSSSSEELQTYRSDMATAMSALELQDYLVDNDLLKSRSKPAPLAMRAR